MKPQKLSWVTIPLLISAILSALGLLLIPFLGALFNSVFGTIAKDSSTSAADLQGLGFARVFTGTTLWIIFFFSLAWTIFQFFAYRALNQRKDWGRISAVVIAILGLLSFPVGTALGVFMLIGAFDPDVQRYTSGRQLSQ
ncbi:hypothetical protein [Deinococcus sp.]|uniref:hypothetical protein n=1 Tax=Deinococcus sp. TaxID=47478 RepID=UPI0025D37FD7|nr:hypothetical protein [Deinococcus sp.]